MKLAFATLGASLFAVTAHAGGYVAPVVEPAPAPIVTPVVTNVSDWSGFYAGLQYGQGDADVSFDGDSVSDDFDAYGLHAGYNRDFGQFVLGGELDYNRIDLDDAGEGDLVRLRGRAGYDLGRFLPYVSLGAAHIDADDLSETAFTYGIGADFKVTERVTVGAEYTRQDFDDVADLSGVDLDTDMVQLRASFRF
ncbi:outer membrane protein [Paracoccus sp. PAMC 22219]|uniref:outer membrane protein n=1 Tax=Paracoccus sp. PAMC 22219 TaxID=1569209 RepID=UPI0005AA7B82|nr:porin family protein [Paracoccus sp. PAMC 22219]